MEEARTRGHTSPVFQQGNRKDGKGSRGGTGSILAAAASGSGGQVVGEAVAMTVELALINTKLDDPISFS